ncbi:Uncharacterised protein [Clostridium carnis]|uniref:Uncharacterized protein n=1 Tax=Clostridium carnis TaxID=1530 RepID=A0ABY6SV66_9CLOT|nr:Uncharacterised protein [Clostridium carnis]
MNTSDNRFNDLFDDWADTYDDTIILLMANIKKYSKL